ncbi:kinase [Actinomyces lilanjuaniae]|uniref:Kinase n=1 Tax=Actinomyces lilanjuaniae TaxID=2321394 RepID=A0ABM6Z184_9ACTO|nr:AAA family ATPase [Actinomyces lilanjuaniae]AYD89043.1 kinase [Actinomyces lilanjuaniae]
MSRSEASQAGGTLILVAGPPGTGKSWMARLVLRHLEDHVLAPGERCQQVSLDQVKEGLWDRLGFSGPQEKALLDREALKEYERALGAAMGHSRVVVSDYPFSTRQHDLLSRLCCQHGFTPLTVRLVADTDVLYERQRHRDLETSRHPGHLLTSYRPGQVLFDRTEADALVSREELARRCAERGYSSFTLGQTLEVDVSDLDAVSYPAVLAWVEEQLRG